MIRRAHRVGFALTCLTALPGALAQSRTIAQWVEALHAGDPRALPALARSGDSATTALLDDFERHVAAGVVPNATADLQALGALRRANPEAIRRLLAATAGGNDVLRSQVLRTLGDIAPWAPDVGPLGAWVAAQARDPLVARIEAMDRARDGRRVPYAEIDRLQTRLQLRDVRDRKELVSLLTDQNMDVCEFAAERLAEQVDPVPDALPALHELLHAPVICQVTAKAREGMPVGRLPHLRSGIRTAAARAIVVLAPKSPEALAAHTILLDEGRPDQRLESVFALRERADSAAHVMKLLRRAIEQRVEPILRREAVISLGALGPEAADALPMLKRLAGEPDPHLAAVASAAIRQIEGR